MANLIYNLGVNRVKKLAQQNLVVKKKEMLDTHIFYLINHKKRQSFFALEQFFSSLSKKSKFSQKARKIVMGRMRFCHISSINEIAFFFVFIFCL